MTYGGHTYAGAPYASTTTSGSLVPLAITTATTTAIGTGSTLARASTQTTASTTTTSAGISTTTTASTTSARSVAVDADLIAPATEWRVIRDGTTVEDSVYDVDPVMDTANPFGDYAVVKMDDMGGEKFEEYERGTRVDVEVSSNFGITFTRRLTGYVVERRETEQSGADALEVEVYSFDQFLRRNTVSNDQRGNTITQALEDIITTDTPVSFVAGNLDVGDDQELTRSYQGVKVENVLRDLAFKSNNEEFGVNDDLEFFFRPRETTHIERGIDNSQWFNYDIPELGKQAINEVEVWFNNGNESVIVDDGTDKLDLQDNLNLPEPGTQRAELQRPLITDISDAEDVGRKYLQFRNATLSGTVTTYGLYDAEPGDTIDIEIAPRGIDDEFVIAATEYRWGRDQTILTIVEKRGEQDGILTELNDSVQRVEMEGADRDAPSNRITTTRANALVDVSVDADGNTPAGVRFVNDGRRMVRDGWADKGNPAISNIVVGDDGSTLSRSNTSLQNQTNSASVNEALPDAKTVEYSANITQSGVEEIGLTTSDGTLMARAVFDTPVDLSGSVSVSLTVRNDDSVSRGVLTNDGQTAVRDVLADNTPSIPTDYAYGSDGSAVDVSQTSLGSEVVSRPLDEILIADPSTQTDWEAVAPDVPDDYPFGVKDGYLQPLQVTQWTEAEDLLTFVGTEVTSGDVSGVLSGGGIRLEIVNDYVEFEFSFAYDVPASENTVADFYYTNEGFDGTIEVSVDGEVIDTSTYSGGVQENQLAGSAFLDREYAAGETHTFRIEVTNSNINADSGNGFVVDTMQVIDLGDRYGGWGISRAPMFDTSTASYENPALYPELVEGALPVFTTRRDITTARAVLDINDTSGSQYVELSNDGSNWVRGSNTSDLSASFSSASRDLYARFGLGGWTSNTVETPLTRDFPQRIDLLELYANPAAVVPDGISSTVTRGVVPPNTSGVVGETIREAGLKNGSVLLSRHEVAAFELLQDQRLASSETTKFLGGN